MNMRQFFLQHLAQTSDSPLMLDIKKAKGMYLYSPKGKKYLDLIAGIGVSSLGHCHPKVVRSIKKQADTYLHTLVYGEFVLAPQVRLAKMLSDNLPDNLDNVYFVNSGAEATEGAMKLAKRFTGRKEIIACRNAYHGSTQGAMSLNSNPSLTEAYQPLLPKIKFIDYNQLADLKKITKRTAAVVVEVVQAEMGVNVPQNEYLKHLRARCDAMGTLLILDEIQTGYGRTGTLWAFQQHDIVPDILLLAKGMGGGMPIGAFISSKEIMSVLSFEPALGHITTFGGHPVSCAAALATLETLLSKKIIDSVVEKERLFKKLLVHQEIKEVRSAGLLLAVELENFEKIQKVIKFCLKKGLVTDWFLFNNHSLRIAPPLIIKEKQIIKSCNIILEALNTL